MIGPYELWPCYRFYYFTFPFCWVFSLTWVNFGGLVLLLLCPFPGLCFPHLFSGEKYRLLDLQSPCNLDIADFQVSIQGSAPLALHSRMKPVPRQGVPMGEGRVWVRAQFGPQSGEHLQVMMDIPCSVNMSPLPSPAGQLSHIGPGPGFPWCAGSFVRHACRNIPAASSSIKTYGGNKRKITLPLNHNPSRTILLCLITCLKKKKNDSALKTC